MSASKNTGKNQYYENDFFVNILHKIGILYDKRLMFTIMYNLIPAVVFGPLLVSRGIKYKDMILVIMGVILLIVDSIHFIREISKTDVSV